MTETIFFSSKNTVKVIIFFKKPRIAEGLALRITNRKARTHIMVHFLIVDASRQEMSSPLRVFLTSK